VGGPFLGPGSSLGLIRDFGKSRVTKKREKSSNRWIWEGKTTGLSQNQRIVRKENLMHKTESAHMGGENRVKKLIHNRKTERRGQEGDNLGER